MDESVDLDFEIEFYEGLVSKSPTCAAALHVLGNLYTARGRYRDGLDIDLRLVALTPDDPVAHYNLACSYSRLENTDEAIAALARAVERGYRDLTWMRHDADLANVRRDPRYRAIELRLKRSTADPD